MGGMYEDVDGFYRFFYTLSDAVDGNFTISGPGGIYADMYMGETCIESEGSFTNSAAVTITKGQYGFGELPTIEPTYYGFSSYRLNNFVYVDGNYYSNGSTFVIGVTTVTVNIVTSCQPL
jgi:hypothetical protein